MYDGNLSKTKSLSPSDLEAYEYLQQGKTWALGVIYDRYGTLVFRLALKILGNTQEAEDLSQEIFLTLWKRKGYDPKRGSLSSFLMTLTRSRAIDRLRSRSSGLRFIQKMGLIEKDNFFADTFEQVSMGERSEKVQTALQTLPDNQRQILEMAYYQGLSQTEIAERLDTPLGTIKTRGRQALLKLKDMLYNKVR
jgi:RNA polymerase sigma-70 factor, ECF subfamily